MPPSDNPPGYIYLIKLHPDLPKRVKIGFASVQKGKEVWHWVKEKDPTNNLRGRLKGARTWVAEAEIVKAWPAYKNHEYTVREFMTHPEDRIGDREQFDVENIDEVIAKGDECMSRLNVPDGVPGWDEIRTRLEPNNEDDSQDDDDESQET